MSAKKYYFDGNYQLAADSKSQPKDIVYKIAGLIFTGQHLTARILFKDIAKDLDLEHQIFARFHLGISYVRTSEYKLAQEQFITNLSFVRNHKVTPLSNFLCFQGLSFYRFFFSEHKKSYYWANKAYGCLLKSKVSSPLFLALSLDLQGHNLIQLGQIHLGLEQLKKSFNICNSNKFINLKSDIETSIAIYNSDYSEKPKQQILNLKKLLHSKFDQSDYSKSALVLQISKLYLLMGKFTLAKNFLADNYDLIYNNENKRKIATLNTVMAELLYKRGQYLEALSVAKIARKNLDENIDISLILPILNLEIKILNQLNKDSSELIKYTENLIGKVDRYLDKKMFSRFKNNLVAAEIGQDLLGDIIDLSYQKKEAALEPILKNELLGLLPRYFDLNPGQKYLLIIRELNYLFIIDFDSVEFLGSLTKNQIQFLQTLTTEGISKGKLIEDIWGYEYDALRHDSLIYTTISRIKKILNEKKHWIITDENKYFIQSDIQIVFKAYKESIKKYKQPLAEPVFEVAKSVRKTNLPKNLNYRLVQTLADPPEGPISVSQHAQFWDVTRMTSLRDLTELCQLGLAIKIGQGKATRYLVQTN